MTARVVFPTAWGDQGTRKTALGAIFISLAARLGYTQGSSLKVPGSYCFEFHHKDWSSSRKIGMKSAYDRALNTAFVMGNKVDTVWIMTFKWNEEDEEADWCPTALQVYEIDSLTLSAKFNNIEDVRRRSQTPKAYAFIPISKSDYDPNNPSFFGCASGTLDDSAKLIFEAPLVFDDRGSPRVEDAPAVSTPVPVTGVDEPLQGGDDITKLLVEALRVAVAKTNNTTSAKVRVSYSVEA